MHYRYMALEKGDRVVEGVIEAASDHTAEEWLFRAGLKVITIRPTLGARRLSGVTLRAPKITRKELLLLSQQLATLLDAGTTLLTAIRLLRDQASSRAYHDVLSGLITDLQTGMSLHAAMGKAPKVFPRVYIHLIEAGERSGTLETVLRHLATYLQKEQAVMQQVRKALTYPTIVLMVGVVVVGILVTFVLPSLAELLSSFDAELPLITKVVIGFSDFVQSWKVPGLVAALAMAGLLAWYIHRPSGRREVDRLLLKAPGVGLLIVRRNLARFSRTMSLLLNAGLPLPESLSLAGDIASNQVFQEAIIRVRAQVMQGKSLAQALAAVPFIPGLYVQMVKAGEDSGSLDTNLASMADFYEREVEDHLSTLSGLLEPAITIGMGGVIALIALSVLLPLFSLLNSIQVAS